MTSHVYISNIAGHDFTAAEAYGQLVPLTEGHINPFATDRILFQLAQIMIDSNPEDLLVLSGHHIVTTLAATILLLKHGKVNFLLFHAKNRNYIIRQITINQLNGYVKKQ